MSFDGGDDMILIATVRVRVSRWRSDVSAMEDRRSLDLDDRDDARPPFHRHLDDDDDGRLSRPPSYSIRSRNLGIRVGPTLASPLPHHLGVLQVIGTGFLPAA